MNSIGMRCPSTPSSTTTSTNVKGAQLQFTPTVPAVRLFFLPISYWQSGASACALAASTYHGMTQWHGRPGAQTLALR